MNDRPTPETDNLHQKRNVEFQGFMTQYFEMTNLARKLERERDELRQAIRETLMENLHLADGDVCTLKKLKDVIQFELP